MGETIKGIPQKGDSGYKEGVKPPTVKDLWFRELVVANIIAPATFLATDPFVLYAVFQDKPEDWKSFCISEISDSNITRLGEEMSRQHARRGIQVSAEGEARHFPVGSELEIIPKKRFAELWTEARDRAYRNLCQIVSRLKGLPGFARIDETEMNEFFKDEKNAETINKILNILLMIKNSFKKSKPKEWLTQHKDQLAPDNLMPKPQREFRGLIRDELDKEGISEDDAATEAILSAFSFYN